MGALDWPIKEWQLIFNQQRNGTIYLPALAGLFAGSGNTFRSALRDRLAESPNNATTHDQSVHSSSFNSTSVFLKSAGLYAVHQSGHAGEVGVESRVNGGANYFSGQVKQLDFEQIQECSAS